MPKKNLELLPVTQFAELIGVTARAVQKYIENGRLTEKSMQYVPGNKKPKIIVEYAVAELKKTQDLSRVRKTRTGHNVHGVVAPKTQRPATISREEVEKVVAEATVTPTGKIVTPSGIMDDDPDNYSDAKTQEQIAKAVLAKLQVAKVRGALVDKAQIDAQYTQHGIQLRTDLMTLSKRVSADCAVETDRFEIEKMIDKAMESILLKHTTR